MSNTCPNCSAAIDADAVFCVACGKPVSQMILCPKCRGTITASAKFCKFCAFDLSQTVQPLPIEPQPTNSVTLSQPTVAIPVVPVTHLINQTDQQEDKRTFITPTAAGLAIICFFLPWVESSCGGSLSGADLAGTDGSLWLVPLAAGAIIGAFFYFRTQKEILKTIPVTMGVVAFAQIFLAYKTFGFSMVGYSIKFGGFLMAISLLAAWIGCWFLLPDSNTQGENIPPNKAAAICYLLFPLPYLTWLIAPLFFIFSERYKTDKFIRFNAIQSILLGLAHIAVSILISVLFLLSELGKPEYARGGNSPGIFLLSGFISIGFISLAGVLAYNAALNQTLKLSFLGDWATKLIDKEIQFPIVKK